MQVRMEVQTVKRRHSQVCDARVQGELSDDRERPGDTTHDTPLRGQPK